ncbi:hypothetical protein B0F90DRAFT_1668304 [Multifurca ochricompacta]|uniref:Aminoglycoside phosphotransferase n=1 Tax=Multifurca ochricompacta TaxID=376703 RepID=A0AAD4QN76_9AGAM|nr:hypothetical protein B0F90DRAFT_1668304 [Multifurca ochricompacta]
MPYSRLTPQEARAILAAHLPQSPIEPPQASFRSYLLHYTPRPATYLVTFQLLEPSAVESPLSVPNNLQAQYKLLSALHVHISSELPTIPLPFPVPIALNVDVPRPYILARLSVPLTSSASLKQLATVRNSLPPERVASLDLRLGLALRTLHNLQSEWCGPPTLERDGLYSWQETFTLLIEETLSAADLAGLVSAIDITALRSYLARAIGAYLFDDVEVPSLVALTTGAESVFITNDEEEPRLALLLPSFAHMLYGDPLIERAFSPSETPSRALLEGYGAPPPIVFPRQRTKRMWYDLYLALVVLLGAKRVGNDQDVDWANTNARAVCRGQAELESSTLNASIETSHQHIVQSHTD